MAKETPENALRVADATQLALERTYLAHERNLLAWVRTAVSLISFGFTLYKFFEYLQEKEPTRQAGRLLGPREYGLLMIGIGVLSLGMATFTHRRDLRRLRAQNIDAPLSQAAILAAFISGLGLLAFLAAMFRQ